MRDFIARASTTVHAPAGAVWRALTNPQLIKQYMFGTTVVSDWQKGSPIVWQGEWQGKRYEDKGVILELEPGRRMQYSHFSPLSGLHRCAVLALLPDGLAIGPIEAVDGTPVLGIKPVVGEADDF